MDVLLSSSECICKLHTQFFWDKSLNMFKFCDLTSLQQCILSVASFFPCFQPYLKDLKLPLPYD